MDGQTSPKNITYLAYDECIYNFLMKSGDKIFNKII